jgi:hypothetical protein
MFAVVRMDPVCMPHSWITRFVYMQTEIDPGPLLSAGRGK